MAMYSEGLKKISGIFANVNGDTKKIKSAWVDKDGVPTKVYGSDKSIFVAVGDGGDIYYSTDGESWTKGLNAGTGIKFSAVTYGNGFFLTIGSDGYSYTSADGKTWTKSKSMTYKTIIDIAFGNGVFVAIESSGRILVSEDGNTWTEVGSVPANRVIYASGMFVFGGESALYTSTDGINLTYIYVPDLSGTVTSLCFGNGIFVAVAGGKVYTSTDGESWTKSGSVYSTDMAYGNGVFASVNSKTIYTSENTRTWKLAKSGNDTFYRITFGNGFFVAVGLNYSTGSTAYKGTIYTSADGITWTESKNVTNTLQDVAFSNDGGYGI